MAQKSNTDIQIFSQGNHYESEKFLYVGNSIRKDIQRKIIFISQTRFANDRNLFFGKHTNIHGIPRHVFEEDCSPVKLALEKYVLFKIKMLLS